MPEDDTDVIDEVGPLIADPEMLRDLSISAMTAWRWDHTAVMAQMGWPPPIRIGRYKYRSKRAYEAFKARLVREAIDVRRSILSQQRPVKLPEADTDSE
jgi:hypothetical protein